VTRADGGYADTFRSWLWAEKATCKVRTHAGTFSRLCRSRHKNPEVNRGSPAARVVVLFPLTVRPCPKLQPVPYAHSMEASRRVFFAQSVMPPNVL
jgi:hypothetical protein